MTALSLRYLVVEDDEFQREGLLVMLEEMGATDVLLADEGGAGLAILKSAMPPVDIVITDLNMPHMDGIEFIRHIGTLDRPVSIVLASAVDPAVLSAIENVVRAYGIQLLGVLQKPLTQAALQTALDGYASERGAKRAQLRLTCTADVIAQGLRDAEFVPFFQPKVDLTTGRIQGFEALARWRRDGRDVTTPDMFIPVMEQSSLICELTWVMLRAAVQACRGWQAAGLDVSVSVNLSMRSLSNIQFADRLMALMQEMGMEPRRMVLEITESTAVTTELGDVLANLSRLRMRGFGLSIDDYGTGYASMQQLGRIAFTELKVDQSFVRDALRHAASLAILRSSIEIARTLKLVSVGEGIETRQQWELLKVCGCSLGQGYFISRPLPAQDVLAWSAAWPSQLALAWQVPGAGTDTAPPKVVAA